jgi:MYXO-CTERM domain-containing protein
VWLVDGKTRRHVVSATSLFAWHRTFAEVVKTPAAKVYANARGPDLPATPFLVIGTGPAVYVLDVAPDAPPGSDGGATLDGGGSGGPGDGDGGSSGNGDNGAGSSGGCSVQAASPQSGATWGIALGLLVVVMRRRSKRA